MTLEQTDLSWRNTPTYFEASVLFTQVRYVFSYDIEILNNNRSGLQKVAAGLVHKIKQMKHKVKQYLIPFSCIVPLLIMLAMPWNSLLLLCSLKLEAWQRLKKLSEILKTCNTNPNSYPSSILQLNIKRSK